MLLNSLVFLHTKKQTLNEKNGFITHDRTAMVM